MLHKIKPYFFVLMQLLRRDLIAYRKEFGGKMFDMCLILFTNLVVFAYFMPEYGMRQDYGAFFLFSAIASFGFFDTAGKVSVMMADLDGDRTISYFLTLPLPSSCVFIYIAIWWAISSALNAAFLLPLGKLILWDQIDLRQISYGKLTAIYLSANFFYGAFSLWLIAIFKKMSNLHHLWVRILMPLYMFGCYFFPWHAANKLSPLISYLLLINPLVYAMEGMKSAALNPKDYLPFPLCFCALWVFTIVLTYSAIKLLKKRLDCV